MKRMELRNRTAVVTGAASGIGRALAGALARRGCDLALADIDETGLIATTELVRHYAVHLTAHRLDVADAAAVAAFPSQVLSEHSRVDLLFNVAGVAVGGAFEQVSDEDFEWLFGINFRGTVRMTRAFLPLLKKSEDARIVNMSSVFGLVGPPGQTAYAASKFAVRGFTEALRHELAGTHVGVSVVHPGGVATSIAKNARVSIPPGMDPEEIERQKRRISKSLRMPPEQAAEIIVKGVEGRKDRILVGSDAHAIAWMARLAPVSYWKLMGHIFRS